MMDSPQTDELSKIDKSARPLQTEADENKETDTRKVLVEKRDNKVTSQPKQSNALLQRLKLAQSQTSQHTADMTPTVSTGKHAQLTLPTPGSACSTTSVIDESEFLLDSSEIEHVQTWILTLLNNKDKKKILLLKGIAKKRAEQVITPLPPFQMNKSYNFSYSDH
jgi:hypothetical protein